MTWWIRRNESGKMNHYDLMNHGDVMYQRETDIPGSVTQIEDNQETLWRDGSDGGIQGDIAVLVSSWIVTSRHWTALGHLRRNHTFKILLLRFKTQVKTQVSETHGCLIHWCSFKKQPSIYQSTVKHALVHRKPMSSPLLPTYFCSVGIHNRNLLKSLVTMSRVTCFIPWAHTGDGISPNYRS